MTEGDIPLCLWVWKPDILLPGPKNTDCGGSYSNCHMHRARIICHICRALAEECRELPEREAREDRDLRFRALLD
jgi:hypothetical protein